jgi:RNA polymerase sigma-70 factor (ECF subfamily)
VNPAEDDVLIARCAEDPAAFRALMGRHQARVFGFLVNLAGRDAADDLFQETWLRVLRAAPRYEPRGMAAPWLVKIARGVALNHLAKRSPPLVGEDEAASVPDAVPTPAAAFESGALSERVSAALAALPSEQREVFLLRELGGLSFKEAAAELDVPLGTALSRMHAALKKLRTLLGDEVHD